MARDTMEKSVVERFLKYVGFDTQSNPDSNHSPSSEGQKQFGKMLAEELIHIGMSEVEVGI